MTDAITGQEFMLKDWMRSLLGKRIPPALLSRLRAEAGAMPLLRGLSTEETDRLARLAGELLRAKAVTGLEDMEVDDAMRCRLALQMALPGMNLGMRAYDNWREAVLYPAPFVVRSRWQDGMGLSHEAEQVLIGQAHYQGPLVFSWPDVNESPLLDGWNVVIHEVAHQFDMLDGPANGAPPLHKGMDRKLWSQQWNHAYRQFCREVDHGAEGWLDPYASENPAEFFAVLSEAFFEIPHLVARDYPELYRQLTLFYRQNPAARLPLVAEETIWTPPPDGAALPAP
ncbi:zinc-dependent peptidase [Chromobacterium alticapitis]|uniref:Phosphoenolpyruvate--glucose-phosphotransferase regulator n=1 Tax=Chromobacterium alticapitis TaxID=2073169 RepID=A0A2S5DBD8_9NEIS|nr:M90 family metallopeptidase [Chromobacterium alticapitis]POZ60358.1 phosphoenolpyruvate--glucose-phosphotransferase regulator [Chromobacterium alticapitis]